jgi:diguanylate cyclase (GGDEF)-like protein
MIIFLNLAGGLFFILRLAEVEENMSKPIKETRPYLNKIIDLQKSTSELDLQLHKQLAGVMTENKEAIELISGILLKVTNLTEEKSTSAEDVQHLNSFTVELRKLKAALIYYQEFYRYDPTSSTAVELFEIIDEGIVNVNHDLNSIIAIIRREIAETDEKVLAGTHFIQLTLGFFLAGIILGTILIIFYFNKILSSNLGAIVTGTKEIGDGNLEWRIESKFDDEFGRLSTAFNNMAGKIAGSKHKILSQTEEIKRLAYYDALTELPNRNSFIDKLKQEVARAKRNNEKIAVLYIDLDDFKLVNDAFGHELGDRLLKEVGKRLQISSRLSDTVARLGGDEFAIILTDLNTYQDSSNIGQRILADISSPVDCSERIIADLAQPFEIENNSFTISSSIGIALYPENGKDATELLNSADTAMYSAKKEGKNRFTYCTEEMTLKMHELVESERNIRRALVDREFVLYFQPQVDLATKNIIGLEALIRWIHPLRGIIPPAEFIPIAEERGFIQDISKWVIREVFDQLKLWQESGCDLVPVMVNLSARDFYQQGIENYLVDIMKEEEEFRGLFGVEVTETGIMDDRENALSTLNKLHEMGIKIALDDFGTGYSSLNYLQYLPIDMVKIDRSFIRNITQNSKNAAITKAIISMSHTLNLLVLAEGIETEEQQEFVRSIHCDQAQGYLYHKPMPAEDICTLLQGKPSR